MPSVPGGGGGAAAPSRMSEDERRLLADLEWRGGTLGGFGSRQLDRTERLAGGAEEFFLKLLGGDPKAKMEFFAPEIEETQSQFDQALAGIERGVPRGGERNRALSQGRLGRAAAITRLLSGARPAGARGATQLSQITGGQGISAVGGAAATSGAGLDFMLGLRGQQTARRGQNLKLGGDIGTSIGTILASLLNRNKGKT